MNHTFEHLFIPMIISNSNKDDFDIDSVEIFDDFEFTQGCFDDKYPSEASRFDWNSFSIRKEMNRNLTYWLLRFPEPAKESEARWGIIIKREGKPFRYFTYETGGDGKMSLCHYDGTSRCCDKSFDGDITVEDFIEEACAL